MYSCRFIPIRKEQFLLYQQDNIRSLTPAAAAAKLNLLSSQDSSFPAGFQSTISWHQHLALQKKHLAKVLNLMHFLF